LIEVGESSGPPGTGERRLNLEVGTLDDAQLRHWVKLGAEAAEPNPFMEADFLVPAAELLADAPRRLIAVAEGERWLACVALGRKRVRHLTGVSDVGLAQYGYLSTPLLDAGDPARAARLLLDALNQAGGVFPLAFDSLAAAGPFAEQLDRELDGGRMRTLERNRFERALLTRDSCDWTSQLGHHHVREYRRMGRRLAEEFGGELQCPNRAGDADAVARFLQLELSGWKGRVGTALASDPAHAEFFRRVCERFAKAGRLQLLDLGREGRSVAMKCNLLADDGAFAFKIAFDETYSRWSPGIQLELRNMELFEAGGLAWMDSCAVPQNSMINRLWQRRRALRTAMLVGRGFGGRAAMASLALTRGLRSIKRVATRTPTRAALGPD
jgi:CelD/BcsL family acetyltransferase involved in cellulose biosynthesis